MKKINLIIITALLLGSVFGTKDALACSPVLRTPQESFSSADIVLIGKVTSVATSTEVILNEGTRSPLRISSINLKVEKYWKGSPAETVNLKSSALAEYSCPIVVPKVGTDYLVYASKDKSSNSYFVSFLEMKDASVFSAEIAALGNGLTVTTTVKVVTPSVSSSVKINNETPVVVPIQVNTEVNTDASSVEIQNTNSIPPEISKPSIITRMFRWMMSIFR